MNNNISTMIQYNISTVIFLKITNTIILFLIEQALCDSVFRFSMTRTTLHRLLSITFVSISYE
jgi:hypothetical protein